MAAMYMYYCLVGVLVLGALVNGRRKDDGLVSEPRLELPNGIDTASAYRPLLGSMTNQSIWCVACEGIVEFLRNVTVNKVILQELVNLILPLCDWAPCIMHKDCLGFVNGIPSIVKNFADMYFDSQTDCAWLCEASRLTNDETYSVPFMINDLVKMMRDAKPLKP